MSEESSLPDVYSLGELMRAWDRGEITMVEVLDRWPHPATTHKEAFREILNEVIGLRMRIAAIDGIGEW